MGKRNDNPLGQLIRRTFGFPAGPQASCTACSGESALDPHASQNEVKSADGGCCGGTKVPDSQTGPGAGCCGAG